MTTTAVTKKISGSYMKMESAMEYISNLPFLHYFDLGLLEILTRQIDGVNYIPTSAFELRLTENEWKEMECKSNDIHFPLK